MMFRQRNPRIVLTVLLMAVQPAFAVQQVYERDHEYIATEFDTKYTSRINAIDNVKQDLLGELGTYVASVLKVSEDTKGNKYASQDYVSITAGITHFELLSEDWNRIRYYVRAAMRADPDEVMQSVQAMRKDHQLEDSLRQSLDELAEARSKIRELSAMLETTSSEEQRAELNQLYVDSVRDVEVEAEYQQAMKARIDGDFPTALKKFSALADRGYPKAIALLGKIYEKGMGVEVDYDRARALYEQAVAQGNARAYAELGWLYERGLGVAQDYERAAALYKQAAELDSGLGYAHLGWLYQVGMGVEKNIATALALYQKSAAKDNAHGYAWLGLLYEKGEGVVQDDAKAVGLYEKSAARGSGFGMARLGNMYQQGRGVINRDDERAVELYQQAARRGNPFGLARLGTAYERGTVVDRDIEKALQYYRRSAELKGVMGMFRLGLMYEKGKGVARDTGEAKYWYRKAAELGHEKARSRLDVLK